MTVVPFVKPEPLVWVCACGCSTHRVYTSGAIECASCENVASVSGEWVRESLPPPNPDPRLATVETKVIALTGTPKQALDSMMHHAKAENLVALISIAEDGRVRTWGGVDTKARERWLARRLKEARGLLTMMVKS